MLISSPHGRTCQGLHAQMQHLAQMQMRGLVKNKDSSWASSLEPV